MASKDEAFKKAFKEKLRNLLVDDFNSTLDSFIEDVLEERESGEKDTIMVDHELGDHELDSQMIKKSKHMTFQFSKSFDHSTVRFIREMLG